MPNETEQSGAWERVKGKGMYPVEYAGWLLSPLRRFIAAPETIVGRMQLEPTDHVLEVGCGPGYFSPAAARAVAAGSLTLFDAQSGMIALAEQRLKQAGCSSNVKSNVGSAEALPYGDGTFDAVFMVTVLGEVPDRGAAVREAARVLKPGGVFSVSEALGDPDYVRRDALQKLAGEAGLKLDRVWPGWLIYTINFRKP